MVVSTDIVGLGLIGFSVNCLMVVFNTIGIEKKDTDKLGGGWGLAHLSLGAMMVLVGVATFMNDPVGPEPPGHLRLLWDCIGLLRFLLDLPWSESGARG